MSESTTPETRSTAEVSPTAVAPAASPAQGPAAGPATPEAAVAALAATGPGSPFLIGVRHHAPSLAAALPALLDAAAPDVLLVELPAEFQPWLGWLAHEETEAPVALAAVPADGPGPGSAGARGPAFYPFADFSPELVALRWAARNGVPAVACDLPLADRAWAGGGPDTPAPVPGADSAPVPGEGHGLSAALRSRLTGRDGDDLWDRLVEALAPGSTPEALRRAALLTGWALRHEAEARGGVHGTDLVREACMRGHVAEALASGRRPAVVVGAFHTPALLTPDAGATGGPAPDAPDAPGADGHVNGAPGTAACTVSLVPYTYPLLDSRSGYPAGIRDPEWQHTVLDAAGDPAALHEALIRTAVRVCAALREQGHPYGPADGREVVRVAGDLARLRDLPAPGRGELLEAVQTVLGRGETYGTGRAVARALERVLVGARTGRPAPAAPRSGLGPAVEAETAALSLPGPEDAHEKTPRDLRLDPARSTLDRRRELLLRRLTVCGIPYAQEQGVTGAAGTEGLTTRWQVRWTPATAAMLTAAGARGVTPAQAAMGVLRQRHAAERAEDGPTAAQVVRGLTEAAECGLPALADERLTELAAVLPASGTLPELLAGLDLLDRIDAGHLPGPAAPDGPSAPDATASARVTRTAHAAELLTSAAVRQVDGLTGSEEPEDARALLELAQRADRLGGIRLTAALARLAADGTPLIAAAAGAVRVLTGHEEAETFGGRVASWVDGAVDSTSRAALTARLTGVLTVAGPLLTVGVGALDPLLHRVVELDDTAFLARLPALRGGFDTLSPAARDRLLDTVEERLGERVGTLDADDPAELARRTAADLAARELLTGLGLPVPPPAHDDRFPPLSGHPAATRPTVTPHTAASTEATPARTLAPADRWRLVLGRRSDQLPSGAARLATALDELYGAGHGEGSRSGLPGPGHGGGSGPRGGREPSFPGVREWSEELAALFGPGIREEVLAAAAVTGRQDVLAELDPAAATPSVELLRTILRYAGGLPEARLAALRPLVRHLVDELTRQLATRLRPALTGTMLARPTRRPGGRLDLPRTLRANLATARRTADGTVRVIPEKPVFRSRGRRSADWRLILVTDVSGSMEASTIWSALTASVLAGVPTLSTHFLAFSTEVVDLTGHVHDPLSLLLEVSVGGGTHIAAGLRHARSLIAVPTRTLVVVISDFEEGAPLGGLLAEVRALVNTGCHVLGCASLDDAGRPRYSTGVAGQLVAAGMPVAALSPLELARWIGEKTA
ncbi:vWA domain-containing protein [Streptomyces sp. NBC_00057]|uniref:vWA domain-containing protein n=1 Tax=Streptomyces sp. NBC_00057 TaxID=2975634 RepID=UPI0032472291